MSEPDRGATPAALIAAEIALVGVGLATAIGCSRLFIGWRFLGPLALAVSVSWVVALVTRRLRVGVGVSGLISLVSCVLVTTWTNAAHTTFVGLPTLATADVLLVDIRRSFGDFSDLVAPVAATRGFLIVLALVLWAFTFFADTAAFRYRGPVQAVIPYTSAFIAIGVLSRDTGRVFAAVVFLTAIGFYAVAQRALLISERRWMRGDELRGTCAVASGAAIVVCAALVVGAVAAPFLPGGTDAVLDLRSVGRSGGARTVVSPFVGVRNLLGQQSDQVVFTVRSNTASYWRLTALSDYDTSRDIWVSRGSYTEVDGEHLASPPPGVEVTRSTQSFEITGLGGPWLPAAFEPTSIDIDSAISFDAVTSSVITRADSLASGTRYDVESAAQVLSPGDLQGARAPQQVDSIYLDASGVSPEVARTARAVTLGAPTPYAKSMALQSWFRDNFIYDTDVDYRSDANPTESFLAQRRGFCQQFASTFALMARGLGLPSRVAVGFTPGDVVASTDADSTYVVRGRHAHTWPEVYFDGIGWVPFEPTTGRGNPQAQSYTDIDPAQAAAPPEQVTTTSAPTSTTPIDSSKTTTSAPTGDLDSIAPAPDEAAGSSRGALRWAGAAVAILLAGTVVVVVRRRRRSWAVPADDPVGGRVMVAWRRSVADLAALDVQMAVSDTPDELAARVGVLHPFAALDDAGTTDVDVHDTGTGDTAAGASAVSAREATAAVQLLADLETKRRYGSGAPDDATARQAEAAAATVHTATRSLLSGRRKVRHLIS